MNSIVWLEKKTPETQLVIWFLITRSLIFLSASVAQWIVYPDLARSGSWLPPESVYAWDSFWYLQIAETGYSAEGTAGYHNYAFFPLYPYAIKALSGMSGLSLAWSGLLLSNACALAAILFIYRLLAALYDSAVALSAVRLMLVFPVSYVHSVILSEGLFLFSTSASLWFAYQRRWLLSLVFALMSVATRSVGILLILPLISLTLLRPVWQNDAKFDWSFVQNIVKGQWKSLCLLVLVPLPLVLFMYYTWALTGDPLSAVNVQADWGRSGITFNTILDFLLGDRGVKTLLFSWIILLVLIFVVFQYRHIEPGLYVWSLLMLMMPLSNSSEATHIASMPRFIAVNFPVFAAIALMLRYDRGRYEKSIIAISLVLLAVLSASWSLKLQLVV